MGAEGVFQNGLMLTVFYRLLDVMFGDTHKAGKAFPGEPHHPIII